MTSFVGRFLLAAAVWAGIALSASSPAFGAQGTGNPTLGVSRLTLPPNGESTITVTGRDYLVPPHQPGTNVFGGVYLFFGWVADGDWGPSARNSQNNNGTFGVTYAYPGDGGDPSTRGDQGGTMRFISFTQGGQSGESTDYHMDDQGNWQAPLLIRGSRFTTKNPSTGEERTFDCLEVRCGVFTIGAHGKASKTNEKFTPISFKAAATPKPTPVSTGSPQTQSPNEGPRSGPSVQPNVSSQAARPSSTPSAQKGTESSVSLELPTTTPGQTEDRAAAGFRPGSAGTDSPANGPGVALIAGAAGTVLTGVAGAVAFQVRRKRMS